MQEVTRNCRIYLLEMQGKEKIESSLVSCFHVNFQSGRIIQLVEVVEVVEWNHFYCRKKTCLQVLGRCHQHGRKRTFTIFIIKCYGGGLGRNHSP